MLETAFERVSLPLANEFTIVRDTLDRKSVV